MINLGDHVLSFFWFHEVRLHQKLKLEKRMAK